MLPLDELGISFPAGSTFIRVNDLVPFFKVAQLFRGVTQHLVQCAVRKNRAAIDIEEADPDLGILEDRAEELLARLHAIFDILVHGLTLELMLDPVADVSLLTIMIGLNEFTNCGLTR